MGEEDLGVSMSAVVAGWPRLQTSEADESDSDGWSGGGPSCWPQIRASEVRLRREHDRARPTLSLRRVNDERRGELLAAASGAVSVREREVRDADACGATATAGRKDWGIRIGYLDGALYTPRLIRPLHGPSRR
jgi:hypothetical protein